MEEVKRYLLYFLYLSIGLFGTGIVIFIHELGHYISSILLGVDVEILSFGFGKKLISFQGKKTEFRISLIPFGGYCRLKGAEDLTLALRNNDKKIKNSEEGSIFSCSPLKKLIIYLSGPLMNLILAYSLFFICSIIPVERISTKALIASISDYPTLFSANIKQIGVKKGDLALELDGEKIDDFERLSELLKTKNGESCKLLVERNNKKILLDITPTIYNGNYSYGLTVLVEPVISKTESPLFNVGDKIVEANGHSIEYDLDLLSLKSDSYTFKVVDVNNNEREVTLNQSSFPFAFKVDKKIERDTSHPFILATTRTKETFLLTSKAIIKLLTLHFSQALKEISGPFTSASNLGRISLVAFKTSSFLSGVRTLLYLLAVVSISICVGNLIPIPTFDGGQALIAIVEIVKREPLKPKTYLILHLSGLAICYIIVIVMNLWFIVD